MTSQEKKEQLIEFSCKKILSQKVINKKLPRKEVFYAGLFISRILSTWPCDQGGNNFSRLNITVKFLSAYAHGELRRDNASYQICSCIRKGFPRFRVTTKRKTFDVLLFTFGLACAKLELSLWHFP